MVRTLDPEKRSALTRAALKLFVRDGVQATTTAAIAKEAGLAAGTLFLYFPTKLDLINALLLEIGKGQSDAITALLKPGASAEEDFRTIFLGSIDWFLENPDAFQYIQQVRESPLVTEATVRESAAFFAYYYAAIEKGRREGTVKPYPVDLIGGMLYLGIVAAANLVRRQTGARSRGEYARMSFAVFWDGIRADGSARRAAGK